MSRLLGLLTLLAACAPAPDGLRETPEGPGPRVVIDWDAEPLPEIPFPNDLAARPDPTSPTGLRINIPTVTATTELEAMARRKMNDLTGFGIYAPITVAFDAPLDLDEIARRHPPFEPGFSEHAVYVIDVTPGSPTYLQPAELDLGHGRFPGDVARPDAYFPNDVQSEVPSILFDTRNEDLNNNGILDPGEDTDGDGWLDVPNVYPEGGDPRHDLLTWYERLTNTLILRPVVPLREETTYAVVLTERLVGGDGEPVRSPWPHVNHTRQTAALEPLHDALPPLGLDIDDVSFAWTFTTARVTGDLVDLRRSLDGEGPFAWLPEDHPPGVTSALPLHEIGAFESDHRLPVSTFVTVLEATGMVPASAIDVVAEGYAHASDVVAGTFRTPNLLADYDDGGGNEVDEWWKLDPVTGEIFVGPNEVAFTCVLPKETEEVQRPFDVAIYGHGYGSSRLETLLFAWAIVRSGTAVCTMDFPGHGPGLSPSERAEIVEVIEPFGLLPFLEHLEHDRATDTDNDGIPDSGSHQWTADVFHTRDQVRQAVLDWMWMVEAFRRCGEGTMTVGNRTEVSCDWTGDGVPDLGGPDARYTLAGGSLGGIVNGVAAAVMPDIDAHVPIVAGGGLMDISTRAPTGGAVEAMHGKVLTPMFLGRPQSDGTLQVTQLVNNFMRMNEIPVGTLPHIPAGGTIRVENLMNGEVREIVIPEDGRFRVSIPADALDYYDRRIATGMPDTGAGPDDIYSVPGNDGLGDLLVVTAIDAEGRRVGQIDTFEWDGRHQGVTYPAGSPLVAAASGLGRVRGAPETRRLLMMVAMAVEPGDPIAYAPRYFLDPFEELGGQPANVLLMPTPGDMIVAVNASIAHARAAGLIERHEIDPRYGMSVDQWLVERRVVHGLAPHGPYVDAFGDPALFDPDDLSDGLHHWQAPAEAPLRITLETDRGVSGMRIPYIHPRGSHGPVMPNADLDFDMSTFAVNQLARYLSTGGQKLEDDHCLEDSSCDWIPGGGQ